MRNLLLFLAGLLCGGIVGAVAVPGLFPQPAGMAEDAEHVHDDSHPHDDDVMMVTAGDDPMGEDHAMHDTLLDVSGVGPRPTIALELLPVAGGYSLHIATENFAFAPASVDGAPAPGEGHAHVYANGIKILRALGPWVDLPGLTPGTEIRVNLTANSHATLSVGETPLSATIIIPGD